MDRRMRTAWLAGLVIITVTASATGCGNAAAPPTVPTAQATPQPLFTLSGTVVERTGVSSVPVEGAIVSHLAIGRSATTDRNGGYVIADVPGSILTTIVVTKDGYQNTSRSVSVSGDTRLDLQLVRRPPDPTLSGLVYERTPSGQVPLAGAIVENSYTHGSTVSDASGHYRLVFKTGELGATDGFASIRVSKEGFEAAIRELVPEGDTHLDIELVRR